MMQPSQTMKTYSLVRHQYIYICICSNSNISTPNHHTQHIASRSSSILNFNTPTILPTVGKNICVL